MKIGLLFVSVICALTVISSHGHGDHSHSQVPPSRTNAISPDSAKLPTLPEGVHELKFAEFFKQPVGPGGLELTDRLRSLNGKRVRILGYMVRQDRPLPRQFLLAPLPVTLHEEEYGFAEDLPASTLHVITAEGTPEKVPFTPGFLLLTGKLSVGNREETDGRISSVRLYLDFPKKGDRAAPSEPVNTASSTDLSPQK